MILFFHFTYKHFKDIQGFPVSPVNKIAFPYDVSGHDSLDQNPQMGIKICGIEFGYAPDGVVGQQRAGNQSVASLERVWNGEAEPTSQPNKLISLVTYPRVPGWFGDGVASPTRSIPNDPASQLEWQSQTKQAVLLVPVRSNPKLSILSQLSSDQPVPVCEPLVGSFGTERIGEATPSPNQQVINASNSVPSESNAIESFPVPCQTEYKVTGFVAAESRTGASPCPVTREHSVDHGAQGEVWDQIRYRNRTSLDTDTAPDPEAEAYSPSAQPSTSALFNQPPVPGFFESSEGTGGWGANDDSKKPGRDAVCVKIPTSSCKVETSAYNDLFLTYKKKNILRFFFLIIDKIMYLGTGNLTSKQLSLNRIESTSGYPILPVGGKDSVWVEGSPSDSGIGHALLSLKKTRKQSFSGKVTQSALDGPDALGSFGLGSLNRTKPSQTVWLRQSVPAVFSPNQPADRLELNGLAKPHRLQTNQQRAETREQLSSRTDYSSMFQITVTALQTSTQLLGRMLCNFGRLVPKPQLFLSLISAINQLNGSFGSFASQPTTSKLFIFQILFIPYIVVFGCFLTFFCFSTGFASIENFFTSFFSLDGVTNSGLVTAGLLRNQPIYPEAPYLSIFLYQMNQLKNEWLEYPRVAGWLPAPAAVGPASWFGFAVPNPSQTIHPAVSWFDRLCHWNSTSPAQGGESLFGLIPKNAFSSSITDSTDWNISGCLIPSYESNELSAPALQQALLSKATPLLRIHSFGSDEQNLLGSFHSQLKKFGFKVNKWEWLRYKVTQYGKTLQIIPLGVECLRFVNYSSKFFILWGILTIWKGVRPGQSTKNEYSMNIRIFLKNKKKFTDLEGIEKFLPILKTCVNTLKRRSLGFGIEEFQWLSRSIVAVAEKGFLLLSNYSEGTPLRIPVFSNHPCWFGDGVASPIRSIPNEPAANLSSTQPRCLESFKYPKGYLFVGPPGTGKTLLGRAVAGEAEVPFLALSASEIQKQIDIGTKIGAIRLRNLFFKAKQYSPCILFFDEIDSIGRSSQPIASCAPDCEIGFSESSNRANDRAHDSQLGASGISIGIDFDIERSSKSISNPIPNPNLPSKQAIAKASLYNWRNKACRSAEGIVELQKRAQCDITLFTEFLIQMDSVRVENGLIIIGTTNFFSHLDSAFIRSGRFDRIIGLEYPGKQTRINLLKLYSKKHGWDFKLLQNNLSEAKPSKEAVGEAIVWSKLADQTKGFTAADLTKVVNESLLFLIRNKSLPDSSVFKKDWPLLRIRSWLVWRRFGFANPFNSKASGQLPRVSIYNRFKALGVLPKGLGGETPSNGLLPVPSCEANDRAGSLTNVEPSNERKDFETMNRPLERIGEAKPSGKIGLFSCFKTRKNSGFSHTYESLQKGIQKIGNKNNYSSVAGHERGV